ncbi:MAG: FHA domain-containing protein [Fuerstiella sp.]
MAALEQINGANAGKIFEFNNEKLLIGRSDECGVMLSFPSVSRKHCIVWQDSTGFYLRDLGSRNQTLLNDRKIIADQMLVDGDEIQVSKIRLRFLAQDSLSLESGTWGNQPLLITIDQADNSEAEEEKSIRRRLVKAGQHITNDALGTGQLNALRIVARLEVADGAGGWPVINDAPVKLNQLLQLLFSIRKKTTPDEVLGGCLKFLFDVFPLALKIAVVFRNDDSDGIRIGAAVSRHQAEEVQICIPVIRQAMQNREALLYADHWKSEATSDQPDGQLKSIMVCPLNSASAFCGGAIQIEGTTQKQSFTAGDLERLAVLSHAISVLIEQAWKSDDRTKRKSFQTMQDSAIRLHESFQPNSAPTIPGIQLTHGLIAHGNVCADLVDYVVFEDGRVGVLMIDCTAIGIHTTQYEALTSRILSEALLKTGQPSEAIKQLEAELNERSESNIDGMQVCVLLIQPKDDIVQFCAAGYFGVYRVHHSRVSAIDLENVCGPPLGLGWQHYTDAKWPLKMEELVSVFSNGVLGITGNNGQLQTADQFRGQLQLLVDGLPASLPVSVCHRLREYQTSELLLDDIAFTMLARTDEVLVTDEDAELLIESGTTIS